MFMDGRDMPKPMLPVPFVREQRVFNMLVATLGNPNADEESHVQVAAVLTAVANAPALRGKMTIPLLLHSDVTAALASAAASAAHPKAAGEGATASCARRAMEVMVVLINVSTELGRPPEQVRLDLCCLRVLLRHACV